MRNSLTAADRAVHAEIGNRLRQYIRRRGATLAAFAELTRLPYRTLQDAVKGKRGVGVVALKKIAASGCNLHWLITGETRDLPAGSSGLSTEEAIADFLTNLIGERLAMTEDDFAGIDSALAAVIESPADYSEFQVDFAMRNADRLQRYGLRTQFTARQQAVIEEIRARTETLAGA